MKRLAPALFCALLVFSASVASAQNNAASASSGNPVELGIDAVITRSLGAYGATLISIPDTQLRAGFFLSNKISLEPNLSITSVSGGGSTYTEYSGYVGVLYHFSNGRPGIGPYVRPFVGLEGASGDGSTTQTEAGLGIGTKIPIADRLAARMEGSYTHAFISSANASTNALSLSFGLSFFTR